VALLRLFEPAQVQIKRHCGLIWHEKKGRNPSLVDGRQSFALSCRTKQRCSTNRLLTTDD
jgi:hypothetical protein